jgi:hypothetical protein
MSIGQKKMKIMDMFFRLPVMKLSQKFQMEKQKIEDNQVSYKNLLSSCVATSALLLSPLALASSHAESADSDEWVTWVTPYLWALALDGDAKVGEEQEDVDVGFSDILDDFNIGAMGFVDGRKGKFGYFINPIFSRLTSSEKVDGINIDVTSDSAILAIGGYYRWLEKSVPGSGGESAGKLIVEPYLGARWTYMGVEIDAGDEGKVDETEDWLDPFLGARASYAWDQSWDVAVAADVGGFGGGSDSTWNVHLLLGYKLKFHERDMIFRVGYRALYQDYESGSGKAKFGWDVTQHGPIAGVSIKL